MCHFCYSRKIPDDCEIGDEALMYIAAEFAQYHDEEEEDVLLEFVETILESDSEVVYQDPVDVVDLLDPEESSEFVTDAKKMLVPENSNAQNLFQIGTVPFDLFDPLHIGYANIYERIFSYLDVKDILNLSEVNCNDKIY